MAEAFGWKYGLDQKPRRAKLFYAVITVSTMVGILINFIGINPIKALEQNQEAQSQGVLLELG